MAGEIREKARQYLMAVPPLGQQINSNGKDDFNTGATMFTKLTTWTHERLLVKWQSDRTTTCNEFVGQFSIAMVGSYLGHFSLEQLVTGMGKKHAFVKSSPDVRPNYGDVFRASSFHMGVSLDFEGNTWNTAESGQGGPTIGYDVIKRKQTTWDHTKVIGWVDIEKFSEKPPKPVIQEFTGQIPEWLLGYWKVIWQGQLFYYYFDRDRKVSYTSRAPKMMNMPIQLPADTGDYTLDVNGGVTIQWTKATWSDEFATVPGTRDRKMKGKRNDTLPLLADKA